MLFRWGLWLASARLFAQLPTCPATPVWTPCDLVFDLAPAANPDAVTLSAEFRSPRHRTYKLNAFRDGAHYTIRFSPTEEGAWDYRLSSSIARIDGQEGKFDAAASEAPGFVHVANVHHFQTDNNQPHLWMSTALDNFVKMPRAEFDQTVEQRVKEKFTHLRVVLDASADLNEAADRIRAINGRGLIVDLALAALPPSASARRAYLTEIVARFAAMNITWMGVPAFEKVANGRAVLRDAGQLLKTLDPYDHPRTSMAETTSAPLAGDGWTNILSYGTADPNVGAVEHQFYQAPAINTGIQSQQDLWNAVMNGQYPASGSGAYMTAFFNFMSANRYWDLEPYFDLDGGRALALEGVEYIVYIDKPGPVEVTLESHSYDVAWINPATGERIKAKDYKGEHFTGEPPDKSHGWVLHISREGHKQGMLKSYKFESRRVPVQEIETLEAKVPFDVTAPVEGEAVSISKPPFFTLKVKRDTRATRSLLVEWSGEVTVDGEGYRVVGEGREGTMHVPGSLAHNLPAALSVRVSILNANGKAYAIDKVYRLVP